MIVYQSGFLTFEGIFFIYEKKLFLHNQYDDSEICF